MSLVFLGGSLLRENIIIIIIIIIIIEILSLFDSFNFLISPSCLYHTVLTILVYIWELVPKAKTCDWVGVFAWLANAHGLGALLPDFVTFQIFLWAFSKRETNCILSFMCFCIKAGIENTWSLTDFCCGQALVLSVFVVLFFFSQNVENVTLWSRNCSPTVTYGG